MRYVDVIVPLNLPLAALTYAIDGEVVLGARVEVLVRRALVVGIVVGVHNSAPKQGVVVRSVVRVLDVVPLVGAAQLRFLEWVASYYMCSMGEVLRAMSPVLFSTEMREPACRYVRPKPIRKPRKKRGEAQIEVQSEAPVEVLLAPPKLEVDLGREPITLLHTQSAVNVAMIVGELLGDDCRGTVLVLAPNSAVCQRLAGEIGRYFPQTALCTSGVSSKRRARLLIDIATGISPQVVVGTRSAMMLSYPSLRGVVVVDEHSFAYRVARGPRMSVRDSALMLSSLYGARCVLTSDVPSVDSLYNARYGSWHYVRTEAPTTPLRSIVLEKGRELISSYLKRRIEQTLASGQRVVLFQNRRGVASYIECCRCGYTPQCVACNTSLTLHTQGLSCHYCGHSIGVPSVCPKCSGAMEPHGRGTQRIEEQLFALFAGARIVRVDSDSLSEDGGDELGEWDIVVGTQLMLDVIDFKDVGVVSIINVDNMLGVSSFRATEDAFRLIALMATRCREVGAELIVQSSRLDHRIVSDALSFNYDQFYDREIIDRQSASFPPHSRMILIAFRGEVIADVMRVATSSEDVLRRVFGERLSPLFQPLVERQRGEHIVNLLLKIERSRSSAQAKQRLLGAMKPIIAAAAKVKVSVRFEVDPSD